MQQIAEMARQIIAREGGFVDDPDDPGGATKYGITLATWRRFGQDLTGDGQITRADIAALSADAAQAVLVAQYFHAPNIGLLPPDLQPPVFDMYVNAGANAVRILQRLLVDMGQGLQVDGVIGPKTAAAAVAMAQHCALLADAYGAARRNYYFGWLICAPPAENSCATNKAARAGGFTAPRRLCSPGFTCRRHSSTQGWRHGIDHIGFGYGVWGGRNLLRDTADLLRPNPEGADARASALQGAALAQFAAEFGQPQRSAFDRAMDGLNRLPRPLFALGTAALFVAAMVAPAWFAQRMAGLATVPEPLWWLLGVIVSFYFGARHQQKGHEFRAALARQAGAAHHGLGGAPAVPVALADTGTDAQLALQALEPADNPVLQQWQNTGAGRR